MSRVRTSNRAASAVLGIVAMVMAGACSSDSPVAVADYRREMNSVCRTTHAAVARIPEADAGDPTALPKAGRRALIAQRDAVRALRAVRVSPQSAPAVRKWLALVQHALDSVDASLRAQSRGELAAAATANGKGAQLAAAAEVAARALGVLECVTPTP